MACFHPVASIALSYILGYINFHIGPLEILFQILVHLSTAGVNRELLTPKIGTGKGLTCGPSLVTKCHSAGKISSEDSVKMLAVGNTPSFGKRTACAFKRKFSGMRDDVAQI
jgi:hypothetical protein